MNPIKFWKFTRVIRARPKYMKFKPGCGLYSENRSEFDGASALNLQILFSRRFLKNSKQNDIIPLDSDAIFMIKTGV